MSSPVVCYTGTDAWGGTGAGMKARWFGRCVLALVVVASASCATFGPESSLPGPGVPKILNLRFEPDTISEGDTARMSFYFEVSSADLFEGFLLDQGIAQFQLFTALQPISIDLRKYEGQAAGFAEVPIRLFTEGVRWVEFYVVSKQGQVSNRLRARLTVR